MNFRGEPINNESDVADLEARVTVLEAKDIVQDSEIAAIQAELVTVENQINSLDDSASGNFTPFNFTSTIITNLTPSMSPIAGSLFIPLAHMVDGMTIQIRVFTTMTVNPSQDFAFWISPEVTGESITSQDYESQPVLIDTIGRIWTFTLIVTKVTGPSTVFGITETGNSGIFYKTSSSPDFDDFSIDGGMNIYFFANWRISSGIQNFNVFQFTVEKVALFNS